MKYYLIAGERSGDLHASNLMKAILKEDAAAEFRYFGGDYMQAVGGKLVVHYSSMAFMGFLEVIKNLTAIRGYLKRCKADIQAFRPDAIILVDYAGFNLRIAKFAKSAGFKAFYYISPKIWAWNQKRALKVKASVDYMFAILPFEVDFYKKFDFQKVSYVGNPVLEAVQNHVPDDQFLKNNGLSDVSKSLIAILPGSREQELKKILPDLIEAMKMNPENHYLVAGVRNLPEHLYDGVKDLPNTTLIFDNTYDLLAACKAAIVTSGTATLETALWNVPQIVVYKSSWLSITIGRHVIKVDYISLVNLIMDKAVIPELIQDDCNPQRISEELQKIIESPTDYTDLRARIGTKIASQETAKGLIAKL
jgi:lipid-A-disaccharide synthase